MNSQDILTENKGLSGERNTRTKKKSFQRNDTHTAERIDKLTDNNTAGKIELHLNLKWDTGSFKKENIYRSIERLSNKSE